MQIQNLLASLSDLWSTVASFKQERDNILTGPFEKVDAERTTAYISEITTFMKVHSQKFERGKLAAPGSLANPMQVCQKMLNWLEDLRRKTPIIKFLRNDAIRDRHWKDTALELGTSLDVESLTLNQLVIDGALSCLEALEDICNVATKELQLENMMKEMTRNWEAVLHTGNAYGIMMSLTPFQVCFLRGSLLLHVLLAYDMHS